MSLGVGVRKICLFVLVFGVFAPRAFAQSAVCQTGWDWVSDSLDLSIPRLSDFPSAKLIRTHYPGYQLEGAKPL